MIHILVVDDDEKLNKTVCKWLNGVGLETKGVLNADDAFDELYHSLYDLPSKQKGFQLGIDDYMVKPIELAELIQNMLKLNKLEKQTITPLQIRGSWNWYGTICCRMRSSIRRKTERSRSRRPAMKRMSEYPWQIPDVG